MLCPGVPDTYQGSELWDSSLVDPDNRRPVDYRERAEALAAIDDLGAAELWARHRAQGWPKLALIRACLQLRRRRPDAFGREGAYEPLSATGAGADRVIAFTRGSAAMAVVPRLSKAGPPDEAVVALPDGEWTNVLTGDRHSGEISFAKLCAGFPVAVLEVDLAPVG
jgi:(1->4)-alpha-D-glucan 1-alpha-D-glucosylmutase